MDDEEYQLALAISASEASFHDSTNDNVSSDFEYAQKLQQQENGEKNEDIDETLAIPNIKDDPVAATNKLLELEMVDL